MRNDKDKKVFQKKCLDEERNSLKNMGSFWKERGEETVAYFSALTKCWPKSKEGEKEPIALLQERLENSPILVLTANQVEANMMVRLLWNESRNYSEEEITTITDRGCKFHFGSIAGIRIAHVQPKDMASFTKNGSFSNLESILRRCKPQLVVSLGVAFGKDATKQNMGDVLVSKHLFQYDSSNKYSEGIIKLNGSRYETDSQLMCKWMNLLEYEEFPEKTSVLGTKSFNWYCGTVLSGGSVIDEVEQKVKLLQAAERRGIEDVVGGEMEGSGIYLACDKEKIPCIVIKGICDWGVNKNAWDDILKGEKIPPDNKTVKNSIQAMAFTNAFSALKCLLMYDSTLVSGNGDAMDLPNIPPTRLFLTNPLKRFMLKISAINFLPYFLIGVTCIILYVLFQLFPLELFGHEISFNHFNVLEENVIIMPTILASTLVASIIVLVLFEILSPQMRLRIQLRSWVKKVFSIVIFTDVSVLLFTTNIYMKMSASISNDIHITASYLPLVYCGLLCVGGTIWAVAKHMRTRPEDLNSETANIVFKNLSFEKCCCIVENISETTLYNVSIGWLCKTQHSPVQIHKCGTVSCKSELSITYREWQHTTGLKIDVKVADAFLPIIPDTLQINYRMPNGNLVVHIITDASRKLDRRSSLGWGQFCTGYDEQVLLQRNGVYEKVIKRVCHSQIIEDTITVI